MKIHHPTSKKVYSLGSEVLSEELEKEGFNVLCSTKQTEKYYDFDYHDDERVQLDSDVDSVVMGYDSKVSLYKLTFAGYCVQNGANFIVTNSEKNLAKNTKCGNKVKYPGTGAFVDVIRSTTLVEPKITGKPDAFCFNQIMDSCNISKDEVLFVGDNLETDIQF